MIDVKVKTEDFLKISKLIKEECLSGYINIRVEHPKVIIKSRTPKQEDIEYIIFDESVKYSPRRRKEETL